MNMPFLPVYLLVLAVMRLPVAMGYSSGAQSESCYEMQVVHQGESAIDCLSLGTGCPYFLEVGAVVDNEVNRMSVELGPGGSSLGSGGSGLGRVNITTYECGQVYKG